MNDASHVARATRIARATLDKNTARIVFGDGRESAFHLLWLRDNDPAGFHPQTEERLFDIVDFAAKAGLAPAARAATAAADGGSVRIDWNDGESIFAADFLRAHAYDAQSLAERAERPTLWDSETLPQPPRFDCAQIFADKAARLLWLRALADFGIALVENTPDRDGAVCDLARLIAPLRRTNFGEDFVVESKPDPNNIAYTAHALQLHTDLPNRESPPGAQFLHCRRNEATGGESIFADGFAAAAELRRRSEDDFLLLARAPLPFRFHDRDNDLRHRAPTIGLDANGAVCEIRYHAALTAPLDAPFDQTAAIYAAWLRFGRILREERMRIRCRLCSGETVVFHNRRVLHGRCAFDPASGYRRLDGCYVDWEETQSRIRVLRRELGESGERVF